MPATPEAIIFTVVFQRWESVLKSLGFVTCDTNPQPAFIPDPSSPDGFRRARAAPAAPDFTGWVVAHLPALRRRSGEPPYAVAFRRLLAEPPMTLVRDGHGRVGFAHLRDPSAFRAATDGEPFSEREIEDAYAAVRTVKNNLFYAGSPDDAEGTERQRQLYADGVALIRLAVSVDRRACEAVNRSAFAELGEVVFAGE